MNNVVLVVI